MFLEQLSSGMRKTKILEKLNNFKIFKSKKTKGPKQIKLSLHYITFLCHDLKLRRVYIF